MKSEKEKSETGKKAVNDVDSSRLTSHVSRSSITFFNHVSHSLSHSFIHILCIVFLILVIYSNTLNAPFQWDESEFIVNNPIVKDLHYFTSPSDAKELPLYTALINRYIGYLTFALNYRIHGLSVTGYHIVNIAIHIANSILVYFLVLLTFRTPFFTSHDSPTVGALEARLTIHDSRSLIAFFSAAIFAVHPLQTEAVTYVFQRFASLVAFFYLLSLVFYIKARLIASSETDSGQAGMTTQGAGIVSRFTNSRCFGSTSHGSRLTFFLISLVSAVLAMKTKENAFTLPFVLVLYEFCFFNNTYHPSPIAHRQASLVSRFTFLVPILLTLAIIPLTIISLTGAPRINTETYRIFSRGDFFLTQLRVIVTYLRLLFFPLKQNVYYDYPVYKSFFALPVLLSSVFLFLLFGLGVYLVIKTKDNTKENDSGQAGIVSRFTNSRCFGSTSHVSRPFSDSRFFRLMGFGILWFFITLSVESSIIPLPMLINEYRMYLPSIGMIICVVTGAFWFFSRFTSHDSRFTAFKRFTFHVSQPLVSRPLIVLLVLIIGALSVATYLRNDLWGDRVRLWGDCAEKSPAISEVHIILGIAYFDRNMPNKAIEQYLTAIQQAPNSAYAHYNLGVVYQSLNMLDRAVDQYLITAKLRPDHADTYYNLGNIYKTLNMLDMAKEEYLFAIRLAPGFAEAHNALGDIYLARNMFKEAADEYLAAISLKPDRAVAHFNLGLAYYRMGQIEKARAELTAGLKIKPDDQRAQQLLKTVNRES